MTPEPWDRSLGSDWEGYLTYPSSPSPAKDIPVKALLEDTEEPHIVEARHRVHAWARAQGMSNHPEYCACRIGHGPID